MSRNFDCLIGLAGFAIGLIGIGYAIGSNQKFIVQ